jgi:hypothetical protein
VPSSAISGPATKDFSLDGTYWSGTLLTEGTGEPQGGRYVVAVPWNSPFRTASSRTDYAGAFRLLLEPGLEYDIVVRTNPDYGTLKSFRPGVASADSVFTLTVPAPTSNAGSYTARRP